jgi:uncharacterized protein VirK/YbjX
MSVPIFSVFLSDLRSVNILYVQIKYILFLWVIVMTDHALSGAYPISVWNLFISLVTGEYRPGEMWNRGNYRLKFLWRGILAPLLTWQLLDVVIHGPYMYRLLAMQPRLPVRLNRAYLTLKFTRKQKLRAVQFHYNTMYSQLTRRQISSWLSHDGLPLAELEGKDNIRFSVSLKSEVNLDKEGDCTMVMHDDQARVLAKITFTLCRHQGKRTLFIGGLQGGCRTTPHEVIRHATKACFGVFPKRMVLDAVCHFAQCMQIEKILAVGGDTHVYSLARYKKQSAMVHADYDGFWKSIGAVCCQEGYYILPQMPACKDISTISSKKRAEYRRRFALLDTLSQQIRTILES